MKFSLISAALLLKGAYSAVYCDFYSDVNKGGDMIKSNLFNIRQCEDNFHNVFNDRMQSWDCYNDLDIDVSIKLYEHANCQGSFTKVNGIRSKTASWNNLLYIWRNRVSSWKYDDGWRPAPIDGVNVSANQTTEY